MSKPVYRWPSTGGKVKARFDGGSGVGWKDNWRTGGGGNALVSGPGGSF